MSKKTVLQANVIDVEKRRGPSKHYVYVIKVFWSERKHPIVIYRRYSKFFDLQCGLLEKYPIEGGCKDPRDRIIPFLPGKILFGRSHIRTVAMKRRDLIDLYCQKLIKLPTHISECEEVLEFFDLTADDIEPVRTKSEKKTIGEDISAPMVLEQYTVIADYTKEQSNEVTVSAGMIVEVIDKNLSGWWLVSIEDTQGWVPASYLEPLYGEAEETVIPLEAEENFICRQSYTPAEDDEIELMKGMMVTVTQKNMDGWWNVKVGQCQGLAPAAVLQRVHSSQEAQLLNNNRCHPAVTKIGNVMDLSNYLNSNNETGAIYEEVDESQMTSTREYQVGSTDLNTAFHRKDNRKRQPPKRSSITRSIKKKANAPPPRPEPPKFKKIYVTIADFEFAGGTEDGISFNAGEMLQVHERSSTGWWYVNIDDRYGWAPSSYIEEKKVKVVNNAPGRPPPPTVKSRDSSPAISRESSPFRQMKSQDDTSTSKSRDQSPSDILHSKSISQNQRPCPNFNSQVGNVEQSKHMNADAKSSLFKTHRLANADRRFRDDQSLKSNSVDNNQQKSPSLPTDSLNNELMNHRKMLSKKPEIPTKPKKPGLGQKSNFKSHSESNSEDSVFSDELSRLLAKQRVRVDCEHSS